MADLPSEVKLTKSLSLKCIHPPGNRHCFREGDCQRFASHEIEEGYPGAYANLNSATLASVPVCSCAPRVHIFAVRCQENHSDCNSCADDENQTYEAQNR